MNDSKPQPASSFQGTVAAKATAQQERKRQRQIARHNNPEVRFILDNGERLNLDLRPYTLNWDTAEMDAPSYFVLGLAKAGSTLMHEIVKALCKASGRTYIDAPAALFAQGVEPARVMVDADWLRSRGGSIFGGFRWLHPWMDNRALHEGRKILMVRDPRDILTSLYFSHAYSHVAPDTGKLAETFDCQRESARAQTIDDYVSGPLSVRVFRNYCHVLPLSRMRDLTLYRYEDVIFDKRNWVRSLAAALHIDCPDKTLDAIAQAHDQIPGEENMGRHVRQVKPGDHRRKLSPDTIALLTERFAPILQTFGYVQDT